MCVFHLLFRRLLKTASPYKHTPAFSMFGSICALLVVFLLAFLIFVHKSIYKYGIASPRACVLGYAVRPRYIAFGEVYGARIRCAAIAVTLII